MNDAEYEAEKERVQRYVDRWSPRLGLNWWREITVKYHRDGVELGDRGHRGAAGIASVHWAYKEAEVEFDLSSVQGLPDATVEYVVLHELSHVLLQGVVTVFAGEHDHITELQGALVERATVELAQAFMWVRDSAAVGSMSDYQEPGEESDAA